MAAALLAGAVGLALAMADSLAPGLLLTTTRGRWLAAFVGAAFFLTAGAYRLARWRIRRDPHAALAGTALVVMGGLAIPARTVTELVVPGEVGGATALAMRAAASMVAMALLLRALRRRRLARLEVPEQLLPLLLISLAAIIAPVLILEAADLVPVQEGTGATHVVPALLALAWGALALVLHRAADRAPWAGRAAPLVAGMAVAEACRAAGPTSDWWLLSAALVTGAMGWLAARSARRDLDRTSESEQARQRHLYEQLEVITGEAEEVADWRRAVRHDARNTCAGLRAAMTLLYEPEPGMRPEVAARLRDAAVTELRHLESLLDGERQVSASYDVMQTLTDAAAPLRSFDAAVVVTGEPAWARGESSDLVLVVRELLLRSLTAATPTDVTLVVERRNGRPCVVYHEERPVVTALPDPDRDAGLRAARHLMRRQGGDLLPLPGRDALTLTLMPSPSTSARRTSAVVTSPARPHLVDRPT